MELAKSHVSKNRFHEAALIIYKFKFTEGFDIMMIINRLVDTNRIPAAKQLCELDNKYLYPFIT